MSTAKAQCCIMLPRLGVNHYRYNHYQWPSLPHDNHYQWQSLPHDNHHHMTTTNMPCTINTCHHYQVLFCKKIITTWQSPPHDNHYLMTTTTTYLPTHSFGQMSPNYNSVRAGDSLIWFILLFAVQTCPNAVQTFLENFTIQSMHYGLSNGNREFQNL